MLRRVKSESILGTTRLGFVWETADPFLFCVHHDDRYPAGNAQLGPAASLAGRDIGQDFAGRDGWRMYHGDVVPGFPQHPHRGFETVTLVREGRIDHADSLGATARFGGGDVQWMTAGRGVVHSEMFPLLNEHGPNRVELFQIWLNLPRASKMAAPHFSMLWADAIPTRALRDVSGRETQVTVVAGCIEDAVAPAPPPESWASRPESEVAIWTIKMDPRATFTLPPASRGVNRALYFFKGDTLRVAGEPLSEGTSARLRAHDAVTLEGGDAPSEALVLQGRPIGEPVVAHGPFVMNARSEILQAFEDYRRTGFGGWPWPSHGPVHPRAEGRFARHADGRVERRD